MTGTTIQRKGFGSDAPIPCSCPTVGTPQDPRSLATASPPVTPSPYCSIHFPYRPISSTFNRRAVYLARRSSWRFRPAEPPRRRKRRAQSERRLRSGAAFARNTSRRSRARRVPGGAGSADVDAIRQTLHRGGTRSVLQPAQIPAHPSLLLDRPDICRIVVVPPPSARRRRPELGSCAISSSIPCGDSPTSHPRGRTIRRHHRRGSPSVARQDPPPENAGGFRRGLHPSALRRQPTKRQGRSAHGERLRPTPPTPRRAAWCVRHRRPRRPLVALGLLKDISRMPQLES